MNSTKPGNSLFLYAVGLLIPVLLGIYWPSYMRHPYGTAALLRPLVFGVSLGTALLWGYLPLRDAETRLAGVLALFCTVWLATSLASVDPDRALLDWVKLIMVCAVGLLLSRTLRYHATSKAFGHAMIWASIVIGVLLIVIYIKVMGFSVPTYTSSRRLKGLMQLQGISLNTIAFTSVFAYLNGMCLVRPNRLLYTLGGALLVIASIFTGSRAPLSVVLASLGVLVLINAIRSPHLPIRYFGFVALGTAVIAIPVLLFYVPFSTMSQVTEGRWDLWSVAWQKFTERPFLGYGYESWRDDLAARLPGVYKTSKRLGNELAGGYHNEYMTVLAEQGLLGMVPVMVMCGFLVRSSWQLTFSRWRTWRNGQWALFTTIFLLFRACLEVPGLFGYGQEPADFLAYIFVAVVVSRLSIEGDYQEGRANALQNVGAVRGPASNMEIIY